MGEGVARSGMGTIREQHHVLSRAICKCSIRRLSCLQTHPLSRSQYAIERNYGPNFFSLYDPFDADPIFQIDANFGYPAALLVRVAVASECANY